MVSFTVKTIQRHKKKRNTKKRKRKEKENKKEATISLKFVERAVNNVK